MPRPLPRRFTRLCTTKDFVCQRNDRAAHPESRAKTVDAALTLSLRVPYPSARPKQWREGWGFPLFAPRHQRNTLSVFYGVAAARRRLLPAAIGSALQTQRLVIPSYNQDATRRGLPQAGICFRFSSFTHHCPLPHSPLATPLLTASVSIARSFPATSVAIFSDSSPSADCLSPSADC